MMICIECWEPIKNSRDLTRHAMLHLCGTDGLAVAACPKCIEKMSGLSHPVHVGRCNAPTGHLGVVSCYCTYQVPSVH